ncbi:MAG: hypothetical protein HY297_02840 [Thaumarchaeota archaeon]|nr:hypothetical protein [Nitrososphaerota archaeon]
MREAFKSGFATVRVLKPAASRSASAELYYYCERPRARLPASAAFKTPA